MEDTLPPVRAMIGARFMRSLRAFAVAVVGVGLTSLVAGGTGCGNDGSAFPEPDSGGAGTSGATSSSGSITNPGSSGDGGAGTPPISLAECATSTLGGSLLPMQLTVMLDTSSSMCLVPPANDSFDCANPATRWQQTTKALRTFLTSPDSAGLTIAITRFGPIDTYTPLAVATNRCDPADYLTPVYLPKQLPWLAAEAAELNQNIDIDVSNGNATQTQTGAVIRGATTYTLAEKQRLEGQKGTAMLLVSDGIPAGCDPASLTIGTAVDRTLAYDAASAAKAAGLKLYVLNLGGDETTLQEIASRGGTEAIHVSGENSDEIVGKLNQIRGETLSCEFAIPVPAAGTPNFDQLNLGWTKSPGTESELLLQSADCSQGRGWQYDNREHPTSIRLCGTICDEVLASNSGKIDVVLGCETRTGPVN